MSNERREHAQARALVNDAVQPIVCEPRNGAFLAVPLTQETLHIHTEVRLRPAVDRHRTEYPSTRVTAPEWRWPRPDRKDRPPNTIRRRQTFAAEEIGTRRIPPG